MDGFGKASMTRDVCLDLAQLRVAFSNYGYARMAWVRLMGIMAGEAGFTHE